MPPCTDEQAVGGDRLGLALQRRAAPPARPRRRRGPAAASRRRSGSRPGWAACSSRAATLTASPVARRSAVPVTTSPVLTPMRGPGRRAPGSASRISTAARSARSASSSCTTGTPNTAITASPMNFSTLPPWRSTIALHPLEVAGEHARAAPRDRGARRARSSRSRRRRGRSRSCAASRAGATSVSGAVQKPQNWKPSGSPCRKGGTPSTGRVYGAGFWDCRDR